DRDLAPQWRELGCVVEQIVEHLLEPNRIAVHERRPSGNGDGELVLSGSEQRSAVFNSTLHDGAEINQLLSQLELARADARRVQQAVWEPHHQAELSLENRERAS